MKYLSKLTSTTCNLEGVDGILTGNQNLYGAATGETWDYYVRVTDEGGFVDSLYAAANGIGDYGNSFLTGIVYAEGGFLTGGTVKAQNVLTQGIGAKGSFGLSVDNTNVITALSSGNVGIGTASPQGPLEVYKANSGGLGGHIILNNNGLAVDNETAILFNDSGIGSVGSVRAAISSTVEGSPYYGNIKFKTGDGAYTDLYTRMTITGNGNVGIGTTSPSSLLTVAGNTDLAWTAATSKLQISRSSTVARIQNYESGNVANLALQWEGGNVGIGTTSPGYTLDVNGSLHSTNITIADAIYHEGDTNNYISFGTDTQIFTTAGSERMRITSAGNVGIGTSSPAAKLQVDGLGYGFIASNDTGNRRIYVGTNATGEPSIQSTLSNGTARQLSINPDGGNVLIGTTTDSGYKLNVNGTFRSNAFFTLSNNISYWGPNGTEYGYLTWDTGYAKVGASGTNTLYLGGGNQITILNGGNVGIGTTSPAALLTVSNTVDNGAAVRVQRTNALSGSYTELGTVGGSGRIESFNGNLTIGADAGNTDSNSVIQFKVDNSEKARITSAGNVGIGTTSPATTLHIAASSANLTIQDNNSSGNTSTTRVLFTDNGTFGTIGTIGFSGDDDLYIQNNHTGNILLSGGNVLIGTTTDNGKKLQVNGDVFIKGSTSSSAYADSIFEVQNSNGTSIMDFRGDAYAFFGCGQGGGAASGFIFRYNDTSHVQFTGYNYGNGAGSYKPILLDTDLVGRSQGVYVNYGGTGYSYPAPISDAEFAVRGRTADATEKAARLDDSNGTEIFSVRNDGAVFTQGNQGWNGTVNFPTNLPGQQNLQFVNGILVNVF